jgi:hypothetical protein
MGKFFGSRRGKSTPLLSSQYFQKAVKIFSGKRPGKPLKYWQRRKYSEYRKVESIKREVHFDLMRRPMKPIGGIASGWRFRDFDWQARTSYSRRVHWSTGHTPQLVIVRILLAKIPQKYQKGYSFFA